MDQGTNPLRPPDETSTRAPVDVSHEAASRVYVTTPAERPVTAGQRPKEGRTPEEIQHEIDLTRAQLDETVSAIQNRLAPDQLMEQTKEMTLNAVREGVPKMMNAIKNNPGPSLLIAAGIGWFVYNAKRGNNRAKATAYPDVYYTSPSEYDLTEGGAPEGYGHEEAGGTMQRMKDKIKDTAGTIKDKASQLAQQAKDKTSQLTQQAKQKTSEWSEGTSDKTGQFTSQAKDYMSHLGQTTRDTARRTNDRIWQMIQENPLAVGAAALAIGAAIGLMIPESRKESEMMGESRDQLLDKAKATGEDVLERTKRVAEEATAAAKEEAREQGLIVE